MGTVELTGFEIIAIIASGHTSEAAWAKLATIPEKKIEINKFSTFCEDVKKN